MRFLIQSNLVKKSHLDLAEKAVQKLITKKTPLIVALLSQLEKASVELQSLETIKNKYKKFAVVGIGGSSLGLQVFTQFLSKSNFTFFDNVDANEFEQKMQKMGALEEVFWLFISKSGETIETLATLEFIDQIYSEHKLNLKKQALVMTEKKQNTLTLWAEKNEVPQYEIPVAVGGRFSILSYVGLVPAYFMNLNLKAFEVGAQKALSDQEILTSFVAECLASFDREEWVSVLWSYSSKLKNFGFWWQQLWAESLAKKVDLNGDPAKRVSTPLPLIGASDQHSVLQQINEGYRDKFVIFLRSTEAESGTIKLNQTQTLATKALLGLKLGELLKAEAISTQQSLTEENISNITLQIDEFNEETLASLIMFMQISVLALGEALALNPLNQPGVERGKVICKKILNEI